MLIFGLSILIIVSEYQKYSEWNFKFLVIAVAVMVWNYKLAREIKNLKRSKYRCALNKSFSGLC